MGLRVFDGKEICEAWGLRLSSGRAAQATQAFDPFAEKLKALAVRHPHKLIRLVSELIDESRECRSRSPEIE